MRDFFAFCLVLLVLLLVGIVVLDHVRNAHDLYQKGLRDAIQTAIGVEKPQSQPSSN
jgi:hypothetical protein